MRFWILALILFIPLPRLWAGDDACARTELQKFQMRVGDRGHDQQDELPVWQSANSNAFFFVAGMSIDADGAPNAYNPDDTGLDELRNAGSDGDWNGILAIDGEPLVQGDDDPFPGYYISPTSLEDHSKAVSDPARYVDSTQIPYLVLPPSLARAAGARLGDFAVVVNLRNDALAFAIYADQGPEDLLGEGSIALAEALGIRSSPRRGGAAQGTVLYLVFAQSGNHRPRPLEEIQTAAASIFDSWGGRQALEGCVLSEQARHDSEHQQHQSSASPSP